MANEAQQLQAQKVAHAKSLRAAADATRKRLEDAIAKAQNIRSKSKDPGTKVEQERNIAEWQSEIDDAEKGAQAAERGVGIASPTTPGVDPVAAFRAGERASAALPAPTPAPPTTSPASVVQPPVVPSDPRGFQQYLNTLGAGLTVDGVIGPKTRAAAAKYGVALPTSQAPAPTPAPTAAPATSVQPAATTAAAPAQLNTEQIIAQMKVKFGYLGAVLENPDVKQALTTAIRLGYAPGSSEANALLLDTPTYQGHRTSELNFLYMKPADQQALVSDTATAVSQQAARLGITIPADRVNQIATDAARYGWTADSAQLKQALAAEFHYQPGGQLAGTIGAGEQSIKQTAAAYLVPLADSTIADWDARIALGADPNTFREYAIAQAKTMFPSLSKQLAAGMTVDQLADPYRQDAAKELGINADSIDFTDPKWMKALSTSDPKTGAPMMMGRADWIKTLRSDPTYMWDETQNGKTAYTQLATALAQATGVRPGG